MRRPWISIIALVLATIALVGGLFSYRALRSQVLDLRADIGRRLPDPSLGHLHSDVRLWMIKSQLSRVEHPIIVMGDSIVEAAMLPAQICGYPVINAGIGGTTISFFKTYAPLITNDANPELVVLSVGINDAQPNRLESFSEDYLATLSLIKAPVEVSTITPTKSVYVDTTAVDQFNHFIRSLDKPVIDAGLTAENTVGDGIHLNRAGYKLWSRSIVQGIESKIGCSE